MLKKIILPKSGDWLLWVAKHNISHDGQHKETLCLLLGYEVDDKLTVTDMVFPNQYSDSAQVVDQGILGEDAAMWIHTKSEAYRRFGWKLRFNAWMHSHIGGVYVVLVLPIFTCNMAMKDTIKI